MKSKFVDTNILLEVLVRKGEKSDRCLLFLEKEDGLWTSMFVISEIEWVLRSGYELERETIVSYLKQILAMSRLKIENRKILLRTLEFYEDSKVDWVDCINAFLAKKKGIKDACSYDKHFDKFDWLNRVEP